MASPKLQESLLVNHFDLITTSILTPAPMYVAVPPKYSVPYTTDSIPIFADISDWSNITEKIFRYKFKVQKNPLLKFLVVA